MSATDQVDPGRSRFNYATGTTLWFATVLVSQPCHEAPQFACTGFGLCHCNFVDERAWRDVFPSRAVRELGGLPARQGGTKAKLTTLPNQNSGFLLCVHAYAREGSFTVIFYSVSPFLARSRRHRKSSAIFPYRTHTSRQRKKGIRLPVPNQTLMVCVITAIDNALTLRRRNRRRVRLDKLARFFRNSPDMKPSIPLVLVIFALVLLCARSKHAGGKSATGRRLSRRQHGRRTGCAFES